MNNVIELTGRLFLGHIFLLAGLNKLGEGYAGTAGYMDSMGVPGALLPLVIALEIIGGLMVIVGFKVKWAAYALSGFTVLAAVIFHANLADQMQMILFMKNISITGGLLLLSVHGAGMLSIDNKINK
ncbi:MAG: DoxX family protein [endosymbiont of Galathealinum brachiosum]|uniref:DoxX family protein n=1 Tax=endosymbiont of Galathealinum brachiosum TaxID=2200906 RepID=A0A370DL68_9GAMM|nr:MAG: DoxX family protein [endosymbiont of Galathealinum brachiosum]